MIIFYQVIITKYLHRLFFFRKKLGISFFCRPAANDMVKLLTCPLVAEKSGDYLVDALAIGLRLRLCVNLTKHSLQQVGGAICCQVFEPTLDGQERQE